MKPIGLKALSFISQFDLIKQEPKHQHDKSSGWGGEGGEALEARNPGTTARVFLLPPQKTLNTNTVTCNKNKKPSERILWVTPSIICAG